MAGVISRYYGQRENFRKKQQKGTMLSKKYENEEQTKRQITQKEKKIKTNRKTKKGKHKKYDDNDIGNENCQIEFPNVYYKGIRGQRSSSPKFQEE